MLFNFKEFTQQNNPKNKVTVRISILTEYCIDFVKTFGRQREYCFTMKHVVWFMEGAVNHLYFTSVPYQIYLWIYDLESILTKAT